MFELLHPGQVFTGRYRIERFLAKGGFGAVYVAEQLATEAQVAIKVLWPHVLTSKDAVQQFEQEARIAGRLNSENIVRVIDAGLDNETRMPFLVMKLLRGQELQSVIESHGPLSADVAVAYMCQVAAALDKAHQYVDREARARPIVHRDLKPENLFLTRRDGGEPVIKVLDFGIAKVLSETTQATQELKGTPLYMAFEQASGGSVGPGTDIWALGLIVFFLLTGKSYWKAANSAESTLHQLFGEVLALPLDTPTTRLASFGGVAPWPAAFDAWFLRCVNRELGARFASAGAAATELAHVLGVQVALTEAAPPVVSPQIAPVTPTSLRTDVAPTLSRTDSLTALGYTQPGAAPARRRQWVVLATVGVLAATAVALALSATLRPMGTSAAAPSSSAMVGASSKPASSITSTADAPAVIAATPASSDALPSPPPAPPTQGNRSTRHPVPPPPLTRVQVPNPYEDR